MVDNSVVPVSNFLSGFLTSSSIILHSSVNDKNFKVYIFVKDTIMLYIYAYQFLTIQKQEDHDGPISLTWVLGSTG